MQTETEIDKMPSLTDTFRSEEIYQLSEIKSAYPIKNENPYEFPRKESIDDYLLCKEREIISFCSYNYLGMGSSNFVKKAIKKALSSYGLSAPATRLAGGNCDIYEKLEEHFASFFGVEKAIIGTSGYLANIAVMRFILREGSLVIFDEFSHNSIIVGADSSKAKIKKFLHNDYSHLRRIVEKCSSKFKRILIVAEGLYSVDGDICDLPALIDIKKTYKNVFLMIDEAHSLGVLGKTGRGISEHSNCDVKDIDIITASLNKGLSSPGAVILGSKKLLEFIQYFAQGISLFSGSISPINAVATLSILKNLQENPKIQMNLLKKCSYFQAQAQSIGLNLGASSHFPIITIMLPENYDSPKNLSYLSETFLENRLHVLSLGYPTTPKGKPRIRFFITLKHTKEHIDFAINTVKNILG